MTGVLAIWHDLEDASSELYERWLGTEHIPERLALPGFLEARRYEATTGSPRFFIRYEVASPEVLASPEYLARLASPTPLTQEVMKGFRDMVRTACSLAYRSQVPALGGCAVAAYAEQPAAIDKVGLLKAAAALERDPHVVEVQVWQAARGPASATSSEAKLRPGGDRRIEAAVIADVMREEDGWTMEDRARAALRPGTGRGVPEEARICAGTYRLLGVWRNKS
jgi:hypothetical protein